MAVGNPAGRNSPKRSVSHPRTFSRYAATCLQVRSKSGAVLPFRLNEAQRTLDRLVNRQRRETGRVRLLVLKARQIGVSTYVEGRFYWLTTQQEGVRSFILTYCLEDEAVPNPDIHCYRTLGNVTCYERPHPFHQQKVGENDHNLVPPAR